MRNLFARLASKGGRPRPALWSLMSCAMLAMPILFNNVKGQEPATQGKEDKGKQPFFDTDAGAETRAAVTLVAEGHPWRALTLRMAISENVPAIPSWKFVFDQMLPLPRRYTDLVRDGRKVPDGRAKRFEVTAWDHALYDAYVEAIRRSYWGELDHFKRSAEEDAKVVYPHLKQDAARYRGRIVPVEGKVTAIRENEAPPTLLESDQIKHTYFAWITGPTKGAPPFGVIFTQMPEEFKKLSTKELENLSHDVTFYGYFLAHVLVPAEKEAGKSKEAFTAPWLVGKTLIVHPKAPAPPAEEPTSYSYYIIVTTLGGIVAVALLVALLLVWHRGGDARTQAQLAQVRDKHQPFDIQPADEETPPPPTNGQSGITEREDPPGPNS
jgi:hypothetical protein